MKKIQFTLLLFVITILTACDKIEGPYGVKGVPIIGDQKVLLEDFTGHTCQACPNAHREGKRLRDIYDERLVVLAVHADF